MVVKTYFRKAGAMEQKRETLSSRVAEDMKDALKKGDKERLSVLRMLLSELKNAQIAARGELSIAEEEKILSTYAKKRRESMEAFRDGGRLDLADKEEREYRITVGYLPERLPEVELRDIIRNKMVELGAGGKKDFGRVMKAVMEAVGSRAEGSTVSTLLKEMLDG
jgi:uncharacterized protein YqeY